MIRWFHGDGQLVTPTHLWWPAVTQWIGIDRLRSAREGIHGARPEQASLPPSPDHSNFCNLYLTADSIRVR